MSRNHTKGQPDYVFAGLLGVLILFGLVVLSSAGSVIGFQHHNDSYYFLKKQSVSLLVGLVGAFLAYRFGYKRLFKLSVPIFIIGLVSLVLVFLPGIGSLFLGARRWIHIGPIPFQPSEFVKLALIIYLAAWFAQREKRLTNLQEGLIPFLVTLASVAGLIILQPDLGTTMIVILTGLVMFFVAGGSSKHLIALLLIGAVMIGLLIKIAPYRAERFTVFLNPALDPQGSGYHVRQSWMAIGSGGWFGQGLGHSKQKYNYLPEPAGDSIFAVMSEELGFVMVGLFIFAWTVLVSRGIKIARDAPDSFGRFLGIGIIAWLGLQAFINMAALTGLLPLTGIPLPFMSHGGSALIMNLIAVGILLDISRHNHSS
jgi:cell division protein FtsW